MLAVTLIAPDVWGDVVGDMLLRKPALAFKQADGGASGQAPGQKPDNQNDPGAQDQKLSKGEIKKLKGGGVDIHELKGGKGASRRDLYKNKNGDIIVKGKRGKGEGEPTGLNIKDY